MPNPEETKPVRRSTPSEQSGTAPPVVIGPHLPAMEKVTEVRTVHRNTLLPLMGAGIQQQTAGEGLMEAVPTEISAYSPPEGNPQKPKEGQAVPATSEGYVRMTIRLENSQLSVIDIKQVPGPLAIPSAVIRGYSYEVLLNEQQIALGSVPDVGVRRSFANRDVSGPEGKHHFAPVSTIDFPVRIPKSYISTANLPKLNIVLHNVREAPDRLTTLAPLQQQPGVNTVEVGRLSGIKVEHLPSAVRHQFEQILNETDKLK
jgi:hypothetical protein